MCDPNPKVLAASAQMAENLRLSGMAEVLVSQKKVRDSCAPPRPYTQSEIELRSNYSVKRNVNMTSEPVDPEGVKSVEPEDPQEVKSLEPEDQEEVKSIEPEAPEEVKSFEPEDPKEVKSIEPEDVKSLDPGNSDEVKSRDPEEPEEVPLIPTETGILSHTQLSVEKGESESPLRLEFIVEPKQLQHDHSVTVIPDPLTKEYHPADFSDIKCDSPSEDAPKVENKPSEPLINHAIGVQQMADQLSQSFFRPSGQLKENGSKSASPKASLALANIESDANEIGDQGSTSPLYEMSFYPTWLRPDGKKTLAEVSDHMYIEKISFNPKDKFTMSHFIRNVTCRPITFRVHSCDETKYIINPTMGILGKDEMVNVMISTKKSGEWAYNDLQHDSVRVLISAFVASQDFDLENPKEEEMTAMMKFWEKHATDDFPYAELHYIGHMLPLDPFYADQPSLNKNALERFHQNFYWLSLIGPSMFKNQRQIEDVDREMLFGDFSGDVGDLFVRDQIRALVVNCDRKKKFAAGKKYYIKKVAYFTGICVLTLGTTWILKFTKVLSWMMGRSGETQELGGFWKIF